MTEWEAESLRRQVREEKSISNQLAARVLKLEHECGDLQRQLDRAENGCLNYQDACIAASRHANQVLDENDRFMKMVESLSDPRTLRQRLRDVEKDTAIMTREEVQAELDDLGIDVKPAVEKVLAAVERERAKLTCQPKEVTVRQFKEMLLGSETDFEGKVMLVKVDISGMTEGEMPRQEVMVQELKRMACETFVGDALQLIDLEKE